MEEIIPGSIIVTGASGSMGKAAVEALARKGRSVTMACRNLEKGEAARRDVLAKVPGAAIRLLPLDLGSLRSVRAFAAAVADSAPAGLLNNAGTMPPRFSLTEDGLEQTVAVNYAGPYLLTRLLLDSFAPGASIVNVISLTARYARIDRGLLEKGPEDFHQLRTYAASKLALMLFSIELAKRTSLRVNMSDPGIVNSNMIDLGRWFDPLADALFKPLCKRPEQGIAPAISALESPQTMKLFKRDKCLDIPARFLDNPLAGYLWEETARRTGL
ncbi:MAG: SDR family NAD(P)-dependent oxidoreductase [Bacteroidales bacterium]|nr:SDR family NAD(P)-dependent oxidoreductase [Bacteroidales bacterium]